MSQTKQAAAQSRRWVLSDQEKQQVARVYDEPLTKRRLARLAARNPRLASELLTAMAHGALDAIANGSSIMWAIDAERVREAVPSAASGASWSGEASFAMALERQLEPGTTALDLGCGAGRFAVHAAPIVRHLICVDSSRLLLREAEAQLSEFANVSFVHNGGWTIPDVADASVDLVFSQGLFGYIGAREFVALAGETRRVLKPGGRLLLSAYTFSESLPDAVPDDIRRIASGDRIHAGLPEPYTREYVNALLGLAGLRPDSEQELVDERTRGYVVFLCRRADE
jgi:SAM-dependent methyltransferase